MPSTFRPYTNEELTRAAESYGLDPAFVQAVYAVESSNGTDPNAMKARSVKRKRDSTIVRGPFQLEDGTANDIIRKAKLGAVNVDDPDTHLDLAMRLMSDLRDRYDGDYRKMAQAYLGGPGGVTNPNAKDELGTTTQSYGNKILAEMNRISGDGGARQPTAVAASAPDGLFIGGAPQPAESPFQHGADAGNDLFGVPEGLMLADARPDNSMGGLIMGGDISFNVPEEMGGDLPLSEVEPATDADMHRYLAGMVDEAFQDVANA